MFLSDVDGAECGFAGYVQVMRSREALDTYAEKALTPVAHSVNAGGPLACYVTIAMTVTGAE